jgi:hypothetical protein
MELCEPEFSLVGLAILQVHVELVSFLDDLLCGLLVKALLVEAKCVQWLVIGSLVPSEPLADAYIFRKLREADER